MRNRSPLARFLLGLGLVCGGLLALAGALALGASGLVAVGVAGGVAAALAAGVARETPGCDRGTVRESAVRAGACAVCLLLMVSGTAAIAGGVVAAAATGLAAVAGLGYWVLRRSRVRANGQPPAAAAGAGGTVHLWAPPAVRPVQSPEPWTGPVSSLPTSTLGHEWLRTTAALAGRLDPATRAEIVRRRQEALDELERRDPVGFANWLLAGSTGDPAQYVHRNVRGDQAAGTDAA